MATSNNFLFSQMIHEGKVVSQVYLSQLLLSNKSFQQLYLSLQLLQHTTITL